MRKSPAAAQLLKSKANFDRIIKELQIKTNKKGIPRLPLNDSQAFNKMIGYPKHPNTLKPSPMLDYQLTYIDAIIKRLRVMLNKSRKIGATETALRAICEQCYGDYMGHNVIIVAGNRQQEANIMLERFKELFVDGWIDLDGKKWDYADLVMKERSDRMDLYSGVTVRTIPANARALRGQANVRCVFFTEAAHIDSLDDSKIWGATKPIVANDDNAAVIVESTPNGLRGFFADEYHNKDNGYEKLQFDYTYGLRGKLFSQKFIDQEKKDPRPWYFAQEYEAKFVAGGSQAIPLKDVKYTNKPRLTFDE